MRLKVYGLNTLKWLILSYLDSSDLYLAALHELSLPRAFLLVRLIMFCLWVLYNIQFFSFYFLQFFVHESKFLSWCQVSVDLPWLTSHKFIHPILIINGDRVEDRQSRWQYLLCTYNVVTACFRWNRSPSCNTKYQKYLEGLMQLKVFEYKWDLIYNEDMILRYLCYVIFSYMLLPLILR
jgi:hypothetical protein